MLVDADGWIQHPDFIRIDGMPEKVYSEPNTGEEGLACHSVVGEEPDEQDGIPNRFFSNDRNPDGTFTDYAAASVQFVLRKRQPHVQMYPITKSTWTSGGRRANTKTWSSEAEGGGYIWQDGAWVPYFTEPLTTHQEDGWLVIATAWEELHGQTLEIGKTVRAHWQIAKEYGYASTSCESGRYANAWARLAAGERASNMAADPRIDKLVVAIFAGNESLQDGDKTLTEEELLALANWRLDETFSKHYQAIADKATSAIQMVKDLKLSSDGAALDKANALEAELNRIKEALATAGGA
jgi:hypothetical protein